MRTKPVALWAISTVLTLVGFPENVMMSVVMSVTLLVKVAEVRVVTLFVEEMSEAVLVGVLVCRTCV